MIRRLVATISVPVALLLSAFEVSAEGAILPNGDLQIEKRIGLLLPSNIIVQEGDDGRVEAAAIDPTLSMQAAGNPRRMKVAEQVREKLRIVIAAV